MYNGKRTAAVILASGSGSRMKSSINKQYIPLEGIPVLARTLKIFDDNPYIDYIVLVVNEKDIDFCKKDIIEKYTIQKVGRIVGGGGERQESCKNGIENVPLDIELVLMHDGARPLAGSDIIERVLSGLKEYESVCACVPVKDTIKMADENMNVAYTPERRTLYLSQTPQGFRAESLRNVHKMAALDSVSSTDDCGLMEYYGYTTHITQGSYENIKITTSEDIFTAENIIRLRG